MTTKRKKITGPVADLIRKLAGREWTAAQIYARLLEDRSVPTELVPSRRSIQRIVKATKPRDPSGPWSVADNDVDAGLVLPVLAAVMEQTEGRKTHLTKSEAAWIARVRRGAPDLDLWAVYSFARQYMLAAERKDGRRLAALDAYLAFGAWRPGAYERYALVVGAAGIAVLSSHALHEPRRDALQSWAAGVQQKGHDE